MEVIPLSEGEAAFIMLSICYDIDILCAQVCLIRILVTHRF